MSIQISTPRRVNILLALLASGISRRQISLSKYGALSEYDYEWIISITETANIQNFISWAILHLPVSQRPSVRILGNIRVMADKYNNNMQLFRKALSNTTEQLAEYGLVLIDVGQSIRSKDSPNSSDCLGIDVYATYRTGVLHSFAYNRVNEIAQKYGLTLQFSSPEYSVIKSENMIMVNRLYLTDYSTKSDVVAEQDVQSQLLVDLADYVATHPQVGYMVADQSVRLALQAIRMYGQLLRNNISLLELSIFAESLAAISTQDRWDRFLSIMEEVCMSEFAHTLVSLSVRYLKTDIPYFHEEGLHDEKASELLLSTLNQLNLPNPFNQEGKLSPELRFSIKASILGKSTLELRVMKVLSHFFDKKRVSY